MQQTYCLEEKLILHNAMISVPFFLSPTPTLRIAITSPIQIPSEPHQIHLHYHQLNPIRTFILLFSTLDDASAYKQTHPESNYCVDISKYVSRDIVYVVTPQNKQLKDLIGEVSRAVVAEGVCMEQLLRREIPRYPILSFIDHKTSREHDYYRWRVYSYLQGDGDRNYRLEPFRMVSQVWYPPTNNPARFSQQLLSHKQRIYFAQLLASMGSKRAAIEEAMCFAISSPAVGEIVCTIAVQMREAKDSLTYFYLVSDILFNSSTPLYRRLFTQILPEIVERHREKPSKEELKALFQIWRQKSLFEEQYLKGLSFLLSYSPSSSQHSQSDVPPNLEAECLENGIPYESQNAHKSLSILTALQGKSAKFVEKEPDLCRYDGEELTEKDLARLRARCRVVTCGVGDIDTILRQ